MSSKARFKRLLSLALGCAMVWAASAQAGVTAERTRVIFSGKSQEVALQLVNLNDYPVVVQAWIDDGELASTPEVSKAPIIPLPGIFRMSAGEQRNLRLIYSGAPLPPDRESLFWLNLHEIPPEPSAQHADENTRLTVTLRMQMKVFFRPAKLAMSSDHLIDRLQFSAQHSVAGTALRVVNPTPYFATLSGFSLGSEKTAQQLAGGMIAPFAYQDFPLVQSLDWADSKGRLSFTLIDDEGMAVSGQAKLE